MGSFSKVLSLAAVAVVITGCASGPKHAEVKSSIPELATDKGRVYFYRSNSMMGAAIQPDIKLNGEVVGSSMPGGFFYVDRAPGNYEVLTSTEVDKKLTFVLNAREQKCVKTTIGFGVVAGRVYPELVDAAQCERDLVETSYTGTALTPKK
jgi:hypothetical protein